jgi:DNA-binding response OmpR family regulator
LAEARTALEIGDYVAVILDLSLWRGVAVLRELLQEDDKIPVVVISRHSVEDRVKVLRSGPTIILQTVRI